MKLQDVMKTDFKLFMIDGERKPKTKTTGRNIFG